MAVLVRNQCVPCLQYQSKIPTDAVVVPWCIECVIHKRTRYYLCHILTGLFVVLVIVAYHRSAPFLVVVANAHAIARQGCNKWSSKRALLPCQCYCVSFCVLVSRAWQSCKIYTCQRADAACRPIRSPCCWTHTDPMVLHDMADWS